jgi:hypothetical protein
MKIMLQKSCDQPTGDSGIAQPKIFEMQTKNWPVQNKHLGEAEMLVLNSSNNQIAGLILLRILGCAIVYASQINMAAKGSLNIDIDQERFYKMPVSR